MILEDEMILQRCMARTPCWDFSRICGIWPQFGDHLVLQDRMRPFRPSRKVKHCRDAWGLDDQWT